MIHLLKLICRKVMSRKFESSLLLSLLCKIHIRLLTIPAMSSTFWFYYTGAIINMPKLLSINLNIQLNSAITCCSDWDWRDLIGRDLKRVLVWNCFSVELVLYFVWKVTGCWNFTVFGKEAESSSLLKLMISTGSKGCECLVSFMKCWASGRSLCVGVRNN